jgi:hypothetical protein
MRATGMKGLDEKTRRMGWRMEEKRKGRKVKDAHRSG